MSKSDLDQYFLVYLQEALRDMEVLDNLYPYHNQRHVFEVFSEAIDLGLRSNLTFEDLKLLGFAAMYHDHGFLYEKNNNEKLGAEFFIDRFKNSADFSELELKRVVNMILDTEIDTQTSKPLSINRDSLSAILQDADLYNLGSQSFFDWSERLQRELNIDLDIFLNNQLKFVLMHEFKTPVGEEKYRSTKNQNIEQLKKKIGLEC